jgi:hypothetical protein
MKLALVLLALRRLSADRQFRARYVFVPYVTLR